MKEKEMFITALRTLMNSWGGDTPNEAVWAGNELLEWYEKEYGVSLGVRFLEADEMLDIKDDEEDPMNKVINAIKVS